MSWLFNSFKEYPKKLLQFRCEHFRLKCSAIKKGALEVDTEKPLIKKIFQPSSYNLVGLFFFMDNVFIIY